MSKQAMTKAALFAGTLSLALSPLLAASADAQGYPGTPPPAYPQQQGYPQQPAYPQQQNYPPQGYPQQSYDGQYARGPGDVPPPPNYDGTRPPPPPPGYDPGPAYAAQQQADARYAYEAAQWARQYCTKAHGNAGTGALIGGLFGAILGNGFSERHDRGIGTFAGAAIGAAGGAAIAGSTNSDATSPGCPPGYVVRGGAPTYSYSTAGYYYAAPGWYRPWVFVDGDWSYRPYPYHDWYYRREHGNWGDHGGWHGDRDGWHGGHGDGGHGDGGHGDGGHGDGGHGDGGHDHHHG